MNALFETDLISAKRKATGSRITVNQTPREFSEHAFLYENKKQGLSIKIPAISVFEEFPLKQRQYDRIIQQRVCTGVILERGRLKAAIEQKLGSSVSPSLVRDIIRDVYELMLEFINSDLTRYYYFNKSEVTFHIYEAEARQFYEAIDASPDNMSVGPEAISELQAKLVT
jgi:hypothetical protein